MVAAKLSSSKQPPLWASSLVWLTWLARGFVVASLMLLGWFVCAHVIEGGPQPTIYEWLGLTLFPGGVMLGLLLSLRYPRTGGVITVAALVTFYLWNWLHSGRLPGGPFFILFAAPSFVLLFIHLLRRRLYP
ncbi:MAG: hypothetical protein ACE361_08690 [Aureliella sp.]